MSTLIRLKQNFRGGGNILFLEGNLNLGDSEISFRGNNSIVFLRSCQASSKLNLIIFNNNTFYIGLNSAVNLKPITVYLSEQKHVFIGNDVLFSFDVWIRNADPHLIYSTIDKKRLNLSKSVFIGDHVWIGQNAILLKGTHIASGSIIGANSVVAGKKISSNTVWAGNPAKKISENVFWSHECVHAWIEEDTRKFIKMETDKYIFKPEAKVYIPFYEIDKQLTLCKTADEKLDYLVRISNVTAKNRFAF